MANKAKSWRARLQQSGAQTFFQAEAAMQSRQGAVPTLFEALAQSEPPMQAMDSGIPPLRTLDHVEEQSMQLTPSDAVWPCLIEPPTCSRLEPEVTPEISLAQLPNFGCAESMELLCSEAMASADGLHCPVLPEAWACPAEVLRDLSGHCARPPALAGYQSAPPPEVPLLHEFAPPDTHETMHFVAAVSEGVTQSVEYQAAYREMYNGLLAAKLSAAAPDHYED
jgi:hypothetical protein